MKYVLCFGDSLTAGYLNMGLNFHPYGEKLQQLLGPEYKVIIRGYSGDTVLYDFEQKFDRLLCVNYSAVIILGGTNDLAYNHNPEEIVNTLERMYNKVGNCPVYMVGIPESKGDIKKQQRMMVNNSLRHLHNGYDRIFIDLNIPFDTTSGNWNDNLHFSAKGYDLMGEIIFAKL